MFLVLLAEFSTSPSSSGTGGAFVTGNFDGATVGVEPAAGVVTTGVVTAGVVATVTFSGVVGLGASVGFVTGARKMIGNKLEQCAKKELQAVVLSFNIVYIQPTCTVNVDDGCTRKS